MAVSKPPEIASKSSEFSGYEAKASFGENKDYLNAKPKRSSLACIRCRNRHTKCPGGEPCRKCQLAKTKCEYVEVDKKVVVSMKYLSKLHDDIARLKKDNATLRNSLKEEANKRLSSASSGETECESPFAQHSSSMNLSQNHTGSISDVGQNKLNPQSGEVIQPSLENHGRLIHSRTGEKLYAGSSSMTLFGLEIQNMVSPNASSLSRKMSTLGSPPQDSSPNVSNYSFYYHHTREAEILEKEGNAYKITLSKTNTRPGLSINFTLPSYSYAMLLVDMFINYNDACFYFFNEGLVKQFLMNLYSGKTEENKKILKRNKSPLTSPVEDDNAIKRDADDDRILESIWFCKILLIFAIGEMYLGTESDSSSAKSSNKSKADNKAKNKKTRKNILPGSGFFYQATELFTGLFASGAIDNVTRDGGIEVLLLYAFFLQVADCTIASYFYFGLALRSSLILGWHVDAEKENLNRFELEHRRRIWWTVYMYERMLSSKAGLPLSFSDDSISTALPADFNMTIDQSEENDVRGYYIFPSAEYINNCVRITQINASILSSLYTKQPKFNILPVVSELVQKLTTWRNSLPDFLKVEFSSEEVSVTRLTVNLMTEYFQGMNLAVRPLLFHFASKKLKEIQVDHSVSKYIDLKKYSGNIFKLLNASFRASINSIKCIWGLMPDRMVAMFGWMDREYLFTSASTLILFNASFGVYEATKTHLDHALIIFTKMKKLGNYPAALRRAQLLKLIKVLNFNGPMDDLLQKHCHEKGDDYDLNGLNADPHNNGDGGNTNFKSESTIPFDSTPSFIDFNKQEQQMSTSKDTSNDRGDVTDLNLLLTPTITAFEGTSDMAVDEVPSLDDEQKLWNEITNDAIWLNIPGELSNRDHEDLWRELDRFSASVYNPSQSHNQTPQAEVYSDVPDVLNIFNRNPNAFG
ncbi:uncharacterized protein PRCAT00001562001 [Priceomyces carsonii]|uniref:uncharacterized protein n=1 Tax=Priceomyces carsonii TaxID=28549 RepID=UPI002ED80143|nr:unnamed protein product [Priceomyces carsonii]